jgi:DNA polymerase III alpha subunit (gram-positive type)
MNRWKAYLYTGQMASIFFTAAIRFDISEASLTEIFGDVHMLNHANLNEVNQARRQLSIQADANRKLSKLLQQQKDKTKNMKKEISVLKSSLREARIPKEQSKRTIGSHDRQDNEMFELRTQNQELRGKVRHSEYQSEQLSGEINRIESEKKQLETKILDLEAANGKLNDELKQVVDQLSSHMVCEDQRDEKRPKLQLCARRVLIVGGRIRMKHLYRNLIEASGGKFECHDGYMKNGRQTLEDRVRRSDMVICPVDCNSHGACNNVKRLCQKYRKPVRMLTNSSLSAISNVLFESCEQAN